MIFCLYKGYFQLYTHCFRIDDQVALAVVYNNTTETTGLPGGSRIFRAKMYVIMCAVHIHHSKEKELSLSLFQALML